MLYLKPEIFKARNKNASLSWVLKIGNWPALDTGHWYSPVWHGEHQLYQKLYNSKQLITLCCALWWKLSTKKVLKGWILSIYTRMSCIPAVGSSNYNLLGYFERYCGRVPWHPIKNTNRSKKLVFPDFQHFF